MMMDYLKPEKLQQCVVLTWFLIMCVALPLFIVIMQGIEAGFVAAIASLFVFPLGFVMALMPFFVVGLISGIR
ncbi:hypothetical protein FACS189441_5530 [Betaproteobacteria bacterium]|nr:hypothetical protein FACS189441_5530 [Betaproteobacteria bacterium]